MKVLLEQDVKGTGKKGEIVNVSDGYARNYLLPRKLASPADAAAVNAANISKSAAAHKKFQAGLAARDLARQLDGAVVTVSAKVGENGRLFGAVTGKEIAGALKEQFGMEIDGKKLVLDQPIKSFGSYEVKAKLGYEVSARFSVSVSEE